MRGRWLITGAFLGLSAVAQDAAVGPEVVVFELPVDVATDGVDTRKVLVDAAAFGGRGEGEVVAYDLNAVVRPISERAFSEVPSWALAVRLVLSEVGADRLVNNRYGLVEAMGVIETVFNRLDPARYNPKGIPGVLPYPGCGNQGTFASCVRPSQYYGMGTQRALDPTSAYGDEDLLLQAIDVAVKAWWLVDTHLVAEVTAGATAFHHACGGAAYGAPTRWCDGVSPDTPGANPVTGPIVFKGPGKWLSRRGHYATEITRHVDFAEPAPIQPGAFAIYLWGEVDRAWKDTDFTTDPAELARVWADGALDSADTAGELVPVDASGEADAL